MNWAVVLAALITLTGGAIVYRWQKRIDRQEELRKERREFYRAFADNVEDVVYQLTFAEPEDATLAILALRKNYLAIYTTAPDEVVQSAASLLDFVVQGIAQGGVEEFKNEFIAEIYGRSLEALAAMRRDSFSHSKVTPHIEVPEIRNRVVKK